jgi:hypothetical protein
MDKTTKNNIGLVVKNYDVSAADEQTMEQEHAAINTGFLHLSARFWEGICTI